MSTVNERAARRWEAIRHHRFIDRLYKAQADEHFLTQNDILAPLYMKDGWQYWKENQ